MNITQFKKLISQYGANLDRWEGIDKDEVTEFLKSSEKGQALFEQEKLLDQALQKYEVEKSDTDILQNVLSKIGGDVEASATIHPIKDNNLTENNSKNNRFVWGGLFALAACVLLFISLGNSPSEISNISQGSMVLAKANYSDEVDELIDSAVDDAVMEEEMIGLFSLAQAQTKDTQQEIESFLDEIFSKDSDQASDEEQLKELDLWDLYLAGDTQEL